MLSSTNPFRLISREFHKDYDDDLSVKYKLTGAGKRLSPAEESIEDPTGQMCSLNGGDGMIPCRELME